MSYYEVLLFGHILAAAIWFGGGVMLIAIAGRLGRLGDDEGIRSLFGLAKWTAERIFIPFSLVVLVLGILLVIEGPWTFDTLWVLLGLAGFAATFATGMFVLKPLSEQLAETMARDGMTAEVRGGIRRLFTLQRIDYAVIAMVFAAMALKPTGDDVLTLVLMAAVIAVVAATSLRAASRETPPAAQESAST